MKTAASFSSSLSEVEAESEDVRLSRWRGSVLAVVVREDSRSEDEVEWTVGLASVGPDK